MTPLEISILLHYHVSADDYRNGDFSAPAVRNAIDEFRRDGFLAEAVETYYRITEKGQFYVKALCAVPLPVTTWIIPQPHPPR